ncbi:PAS domain-containing sensor histidine kinase [Larkinella sp. VNQ87]|uniref:PAS domain-containing sensor histidine kinase n=1 Tax=Larkinella sp. VNQ87 TaxID=3400921 RepID=UPI003C0C9C13
MNTDLKPTNELFELLTKATRDVVWNWDLEANTVWWNEAYTAVFGYPQPTPEPGPESWYDYIHPDDREDVLESIHQVIDQAGSNWSAEYRFRRADGSYIIVYDRGYVMHRQGKAVRMVGSMQDITERVTLQKARHESEERLRFALQSAQLGTWDLNPADQTITWDARCQALFGLRDANPSAYSQVAVHIHPDDRQRVEDAVQWALNPESGGYYDIQYRTIGADDGVMRQVHFMGQAYFTETGQAYRFSGVARDISDEVKAREKTALSEHQAQLALEGSGAGSFSIDLETNAIVYSPALSLLLTGEARTDLTRDVFVNHLHPDDRSIREKAYRVAMRTGNLHYEARFVWNNREIHWIKALGQYFYNTAGKPVTFSGIVIDITQQKEADQAMHKAEERFRNMVAQAPVAIGIVSGENLIIETANQAMLAVWGKESSILGLPLIEALPEIRDQGFIELLQTVYKTGVAHYGFETLARLQRNGQLEEAYFNFVYAPIREESNRVGDIMILAIEVTAQVKAKQALEDSEQRLRSLIEEAPAAIALFTGPDMVIELPNEAMIKFWGKGPAVAGKPLREALPELVGQPFLHILDEVYRTGIAYTAQEDEAMLIVDGKPGIYYFNYTYKPLRNADGEVYAILEVAIDVTEQVLARRKIEASEQRFRTLLEAISPMTWTNTPTGEATFFNQQWYSYTGLSLEESIDWGWEAVLHPDDLPHTLALYQRSLETGEIYVSENRYRRGSDGMYRWHLNRALPIRDETGTIMFWVGTATDIHEQKRIEAELESQVQVRTRELNESNQHLLRSNENLTRFAYVASHDLQEPLRKIQSFGNLLESQYAAGLGESGIDLINRMQSSAGRMSELIRDLLAYSRISTRQQSFDPVLLEDVILNVRETLELQIQQAGAVIESDVLPTVHGDASQLGQLFQNLLSNAIKFGRPGVPPHIWITYELLPGNALPATVQTARYASQYHLISVTDNGIGFDEKYADRIFEVFQRLHGRTSYAGTGVGLAICQKVVENHGGAIKARSQPGQGSTFRVYLPA